MSRESPAVSLRPADIVIGSFSDAARGIAGIVVIIDVFRAFTCAAIALANGAARIIMVDDLDTALALRKRNIGGYCIGERRGIRPPGLGFGNSPADLLDVRFDGEALVQTTSSGTRGILAASGASRIYAGSFVMAEATVCAIANGPMGPVTLIAMGEKDRHRADEDELCALYLRSRLVGRDPDQAALRALVETTSPRTDANALCPKDVSCCLNIDTAPFAIRVQVEDGLCVATAEQDHRR